MAWPLQFRSVLSLSLSFFFLFFSFFGLFAFWEYGEIMNLFCSRTKCHKLGWFGAVDTFESMRQILDEFVGLRMLPPLPGFKDQ